MTQPILPSNRAINRLRATAALMPIIESGLADSRISIERAVLMASFCEWTTENPPGDPEAAKLAKTVGNGLKRIKVKLSSAT